MKLVEIMNKKELTEKVTGWILALTVYTVAVFYLLNKVLGITGDDLDALVSLLGVGATLFGGYMAIYLFTDWREQTNKQMLANEAKELWKSTKELEKQFLSIDDYYSSTPEYIEYNNSKYYKHIHTCDKNASNLHLELFYFAELSRKNNYDLFLNSFEVLKAYRETISSDNYKYEKDIYKTEKDEREKYIQQIEKIKEHLLSFIHV